MFSGKIIFASWLLITPLLAQESSLKFFSTPNQEINDPTTEKQLNLSQIRGKIISEKITLFDPFYKKKKSYEAFPLKEILDLGYGRDWRKSRYSDIQFVASTGYQSTSSTFILKEDGAYIAIRDIEFPEWELFPTAKVNPGPFYVFWTGMDQKDGEKYIWFWQLSSFRLLQFADQYPKVTPVNVKKDSSVYQGFEIFRGQCFKCHAIDRQGGNVGPDLQSPQNVVSYRSKKFLREFIKQPSKYRYSAMPDNPYLTPKNVEDLISYLEYTYKRFK